MNATTRALATALVLFLALAGGVGRSEAQNVIHCPAPALGIIDTGGSWCMGPLMPTWEFSPGACGCTNNKFYYVTCLPPGYGGALENQGCGIGACYTIEGGPCLSADVEIPSLDCHKGAGGSPAPPAAEGKPVSLTTGAVFFTHADAAVGELSLTRTYNSGRLASGRYGPFGAGWNASTDLRLRVLSPTTIEVRLSDGFAQYYFDNNGDAVYEGILPLTKESRLEVVSGGAGGYRRVLRSGGLETYNASGRIVSVADPAGVATTYAYDGQGRFSSVTRRGRSISLGYSDDSNRPSQALGPGGVVLATYAYTAANALDTVRYPDGGGYRYGYDAAGNMAWVSDLDGTLIERHEYSSGKATTSETTDGREKLTFAYGPTQTTVTDATGAVTVYEYQTIAHVPAVTKASGPCSACGASGGSGERRWSYDDAGNVVQYQNEMGDVWKYTYTPDNDLLSETNPLDQTTSYTYYSDGRVHTRGGPDGSLTSYVYGPAGPLSVAEKVSASETRTTSMTYTPQGQVETVSDPRLKVTRMTYTPTGDLETVSDPLTHITRFGYDAFGRRASVQDALLHTTTTSYDARGRVTSLIQHDGTHTDFGYDTRGRRTSVTDPEGHVTRSVYNTYGWLEQVIDPAEGVTRYGYDLMGRLTSLTDALGRATRFVYEQGRLMSTIYPGAGDPSETYSYDPAGRIRTKTDRKGIVTTYEYEPLGRLLRKSYSDGTPDVTFHYDEGGAIGRLTSASNGSDTLRWSYDLAGQMKSEESNRNASVVSYLYDAAGSRASLSLDGQLWVTYAYDDASRLLAIARGPSVFGLEYDDANRRTRMTYPNAIATSYSYDNLNRLTGLTAVHNGATTITSFGYSYDDAGNRLTKATPEFTEAYTYDPLYRLRGVERAGGATGLWQYGYDAVGNRVASQVGDAILSSTYDERNQLRSSSSGGSMLWRGSLNEAGNVSFTSALVNGQPARMLGGNVFEAELDMTPGTNTVTVQATDISGNVTTRNYAVDVAATGASYTYDPNGNLAGKTEGTDTWGYEWNAENQLTRVTKNSIEQARFGYDPKGRRVEKVTGGVTTSYTYDGQDILREVRGGTTLKYVQGPGVDEPLAVDDGTALSYLHADGLGGIVKMTSTAGAVTLTRQYDAWGNLQVGSDQSGYAYTGREWDPATGLYYYRARYYDPKIGRFLSEDPIPIGQRKLEELNPYAYVANNPVNFIDPSGAQCFILGTQTPVIDPYIMWGRQPPVFRPFPNQTFNEAARPVRPTPPRPFVPQPQPLPVIDPTPAQIGPRMPWWLKLWKGLVEPWYDEAPAVPAKPDDKCGCVA